MATSGYFKLEGLEEYMDALAEAEADIDGLVRDAAFEFALSMQEEMQSSVPVLTGRLFEHILIDGPHTEGNYTWVEVGVIHNIAFTPKDVAIQANVIEYGSARQAAQPFIRPALKKGKRLMKNAFEKILEKYGIRT